MTGARRLPDDIRIATDHLAESALEPPDPDTGADIHVVDATRRQRVRAPDVIDVAPVTDFCVSRACAATRAQSRVVALLLDPITLSIFPEGRQERVERPTELGDPILE